MYNPLYVAKQELKLHMVFLQVLWFPPSVQICGLAMCE